MNERYSELQARLVGARRAFLVRLSVFSATSALGVMGLILWNDDLRVFIIASVLLLFSLLRIGVLFKQKTVKIFGKERRGVIVDKTEKVRIHDEKAVGGFGSFSEIRPYEHSRTEIAVGTILIKEANGSIFSIGELTEDQTAFYEVGDEVVLLPGAKFPLVENEPEARQKWLCPICGTVLPDGVDCTVCGLAFS